MSVTNVMRAATLLCLLLPGRAFAAETPPAQPAARTIILVRHGAYVADPADSSPGPGLSPIGVAQAQLVAARLRGMPRFDAFFSSPMTRARETAKVIDAALDTISADVLPDLAECTPQTRRREITKEETAEKMTQCEAKLDSVFAKYFVPAQGAERTELFVCHGNVIRYLVTRALAVDTQSWLEMSVGHASITKIRVEADGRFKVISVGDIGHIPENMQTGATGMSDKSLAVPQ